MHNRFVAPDNRIRCSFYRKRPNSLTTTETIKEVLFWNRYNRYSCSTAETTAVSSLVQEKYRKVLD